MSTSELQKDIRNLIKQSRDLYPGRFSNEEVKYLKSISKTPEELYKNIKSTADLCKLYQHM